MSHILAAIAGIRSSAVSKAMTAITGAEAEDLSSAVWEEEASAADEDSVEEEDSEAEVSAEEWGEAEAPAHDSKQTEKPEKETSHNRNGRNKEKCKSLSNYIIKKTMNE